MKRAELSPVTKGFPALSEREKEALRLLLVGHDAKSIARDLRLSVHTVNERLRDARRKLGVSSSREAARLLAAREQTSPSSLVDKPFGIASEVISPPTDTQTDHRQGAGSPLVWLSGGMLIMSLIIASVVLASMLQASGAADVQRSEPVVAAASSAPAQSAGASAAREWVALIDGQQWENSWRAAGTLFRSQLTASQWASTVQPVRGPLGKVSTRTLQSAAKTNSLPGAPAGDYEIVQFQTSFAARSSAVETVILAREGSDWKVVGYFIR